MSNKVLVEISARHLHLSDGDLETLFGKGFALTNKKDLSQPGQFACVERVDVVGPKSTMKGVTIIGPTRKATQVEVSSTDARALGIAAPIRESGIVAGSGACKLVGPCGELDLAEGVIVAKRHIHFDPKTAADMGIVDNQGVQVKFESPDRSLIFDDVVCRVNEAYAFAMHIDVDESNAAGCTPNFQAEIIKK